MFRLVCIDKMDDRREIAIDDNNMATTFYNGKLTGKYSLHSDEVIEIERAESADEAFAVLERIED